MFERARFTERAYMAVVFARHECCPRGPRPVRPEHLLLGLLSADPELFRALAPGGAGVVEGLRGELKAFTAGRAESWLAPAPPPFSRAAAEVLAVAGEESRKAGRALVGTDDLLLGLLKSERRGWLGLLGRGPTRVSRVLRARGLSPEAITARAPGGPITPQSRPEGELPTLGPLAH